MVLVRVGQTTFFDQAVGGDHSASDQRTNLLSEKNVAISRGCQYVQMAILHRGLARNLRMVYDTAPLKQE